MTIYTAVWPSAKWLYTRQPFLIQKKAIYTAAFKSRMSIYTTTGPCTKMAIYTAAVLNAKKAIYTAAGPSAKMAIYTTAHTKFSAKVAAVYIANSVNVFAALGMTRCGFGSMQYKAGNRQEVCFDKCFVVFFLCVSLRQLGKQVNVILSG